MLPLQGGWIMAADIADEGGVASAGRRVSGSCWWMTGVREMECKEMCVLHDGWRVVVMEEGAGVGWLSFTRIHLLTLSCLKSYRDEEQ